MASILVIEDDIKLRDELVFFLKRQGYEVSFVSTFSNTLKQMLESSSDLILLDINLPLEDGTYLLREFRKTSKTPVIMLTSRNQAIDEVLCIQNGACDYITKPYHPQVLLARIESVLKRNTIEEPLLIPYEGFRLNVSRSVIETGEEIIELTKNELRIFYYLLEHRAKIVSREELMDYLWNTEEFINDNTLTVNVNRLRKKLADVGYPEALQTRRGQGYLLI